jgi:Flp pilus assembly protein TadG
MPRRLLTDTHGNTAIEAAIVLPTLLLTMIIIIEVMWSLWVEAALESALTNAARLGMTGYTPAGVDRRTAIMQQVSNRTLGLVTDGTATIQTLVYGDFSQIGVPEPYDDTAPHNGHYDPGEHFIDVNGNGHWDADMGAAGLGGPGQVVVYTVTYNSPFLTPLQHWIGGSGFLALQASAVVRNEPWGGG